MIYREGYVARASTSTSRSSQKQTRALLSCAHAAFSFNREAVMWNCLAFSLHSCLLPLTNYCKTRLQSSILRILKSLCCAPSSLPYHYGVHLESNRNSVPRHFVLLSSSLSWSWSLLVASCISSKEISTPRCLFTIGRGMHWNRYTSLH